MLDKQYHLYSVDTGHFYSSHERYLHNMNCKYRQERNYIKNELEKIEKEFIDTGFLTAGDIKHLKNRKIEELNITIFQDKAVKRYMLLQHLIVHKRKKAKESKDKLLKLLANKVQYNIDTNGTDHIRNLDDTTLNDNNVVSMFDSFLSRTLKIEEDELTDNLIIVQIYYFDVFKDISFFGFIRIYKSTRDFKHEMNCI